MRLGYLTSIAIIPLMMFTANLDQGNSHKDKGNKEQKGHDDDERGGRKDNGNNGRDDRGEHWENGRKDKNGHDEGRGDNNWKHGENKYGNKHEYKQNKHDDKDWNDREGRFYIGSDGQKWRLADRWDNGQWDNERFDKRMNKIKHHKKDNWVNQRYYQGINWWDGTRYYEAKAPRDNKKVTLCHTPNGSGYPVTIKVSVNALQAHLNHGDYEGECKDWDRTKYSNTYWSTRTDYYNQYEQTTENLSFGEQLLALAINKLTGAKTQLITLRPTLSPAEINKREVAIINLQNDTYTMQQTLDRGNNSIATINFAF